MDLFLLKEFIRSRLENLGGSRLAMAIKDIGSTTRATFYDAYELANKVESGEKDPEIPIVGRAVISDYDINEINAKPEYEELIKKIVEDMRRMKSGNYMELVRNHYRMVNYLKNKGLQRAAATLTYSIV